MAIQDYTTATLIKEALPVGAQAGAPTFGSGQDTYLGKVATRVSRMIDGHCRRPNGYFFVNADTTQYFDGHGAFWLNIDDLAAAPTSLSVSTAGVVDSSAGTGGTYTAWTAADYLLLPFNAVAEGKPYNRIEVNLNTSTYDVFPNYVKGIKIVGKFGYATAIPDDIAQAAAILGAWLYKRGLAGYQVDTANTDLGKLTYSGGLDLTVVTTLEQYKRSKKKWPRPSR